MYCGPPPLTEPALARPVHTRMCTRSHTHDIAYAMCCIVIVYFLLYLMLLGAKEEYHRGNWSTQSKYIGEKKKDINV